MSEERKKYKVMLSKKQYFTLEVECEDENKAIELAEKYFALKAPSGDYELEINDSEYLATFNYSESSETELEDLSCDGEPIDF